MSHASPPPPPLSGILRNSSLLIAVQVCSSLIGLALAVLLPRFLGDVEFGRLYLALSLTLMFGVAVDFGLTQVVTRAVARRPGLARSYVRSSLTVIAPLGIALYVALLASVRLLGYHERVLTLATVLGVVMVSDALSQVLGAVSQAHERMLAPALARIAGNGFTLAVGFLLVLQGHGATAVAGVMALAALLRLALTAMAVRRLNGFHVPVTAEEGAFALLAAGLPFLVWQALATFYYRMDVVMLGWLTTDATLGWYGVASRLRDSVSFAPYILTMATFPVAARLWVTAPAEFHATVRKTLQLVLVLATPLVVLLLTLAREIVDVLFTTAFAPAVPILRIHAVTLGLVCVNVFLVGILMVTGRERTWIAVAAAACVVSPTLSRLLIPLTDSHYGNGGIGAALGTLLTEGFITVCALRLFPAGTLGAESWQAAMHTAGAGIVMGCVVILGRAVDVPWMLVAAAGGGAYFALVIRLGSLPADATAWIQAAIQRASTRVA